MASGSCAYVPPQNEICNDVPASNPYSGQYGFHIGFWKQAKDISAPVWTFSEVNAMVVYCIYPYKRPGGDAFFKRGAIIKDKKSTLEYSGNR